MAEIRLYFADCAGVPENCRYPHEATIADEDVLRKVVLHDYVCVAYPIRHPRHSAAKAAGADHTDETIRRKPK